MISEFFNENDFIGHNSSSQMYNIQNYKINQNRENKLKQIFGIFTLFILSWDASINEKLKNW